MAWWHYDAEPIDWDALSPLALLLSLAIVLALR